MNPTTQRIVLCTILLFLVAFQTHAQAPAEFGKVEVNLLKKPASEIDKTAEAEVLYDNADIFLTLIGGHLEISIKAHVRIKIYNQNGLDFANINIPYIPREGSEDIYKLEAQTYNLNDQGNIVVSKMDKKSVYIKKVDNRYSKQIFTLPEVKAGSVIEYRYTLKRNLLYFDDWEFQRDIPVVYSNCSFEYPTEFSFTQIPQTRAPIETTNRRTDYTTRQTFTMRNLPAVKEEPYMTSADDYRQKIKFKILGYFSPALTLDLKRTWPGLIKELMDDEDFGQQLTKNIPRTSELNEILKVQATPQKKMVAVHEFVKKNMAWDEGYSLWALDGVKKAWDKKKGNSGEINLILVNLLKDAGLKAYPVLVSTHDYGRINPMDPGLRQFNTVMAFVTIDSSFYVLDATDKNTPCGLIPASVVYTEGLVINKLEYNKPYNDQDWGWRTLWNEKQIFQKLVNVSAHLSDKGTVSGNAYVMQKDYARRDWTQKVEPDAEKTTGYYTSHNASVKLTEMKIRNEANDSLPLEHTFEFEGPIEENGDYLSYNLNLFTSLEKNPFLAEERHSDVFFGYGQKYTLRGSLTIPEGFVFEEPPKDLKMVMPDRSIEMVRILEINGQNLRYSITVEFKKPYYPAERYEEFREFYKKMYSLLNEQVVMKKIKAKP
jgi:hypothetical protein